MSTSAQLRRQPAVIINRRSSIGRDGARLNTPSGHQIEPATAMFNDHLNHHLVLSIRQARQRPRQRPPRSTAHNFRIS
jgi:hypothetical protein